MALAVSALLLTFAAISLCATNHETATEVSPYPSPVPGNVRSSIAGRIVTEVDAVVEATVEQRAQDIFVAVVVDYDTGESAAGEVIQNALRLVSEALKGEEYSFGISVSYPDGKQIAGAVWDRHGIMSSADKQRPASDEQSSP